MLKKGMKRFETILIMSCLILQEPLLVYAEDMGEIETFSSDDSLLYDSAEELDTENDWQDIEQ